MVLEEGPVWRRSRLSVQPGSRLPLVVYTVGGLIALSGFVCLILSFFIGPIAFDYLWGIEPLAYIGGVALMVGFLTVTAGLAATAMNVNKRNQGRLTGEEQSEHWRETTRQFFELVDHDLGRPLRRIAGKERELRAAMRAAGGPEDPSVQELLDEIARQTPNFRLMLSNIQVLVQLEAPGRQDLPPGRWNLRKWYGASPTATFPVAAEAGKELTWWAEPPDFGIVSSDSHAIEHIVANLVDNAVTHAAGNVEISLSRRRHPLLCPCLGRRAGHRIALSGIPFRPGLDAGSRYGGRRRPVPGWACSSPEPWPGAAAAS